MLKLEENFEATAGVVWYPKVAVTLLAACRSFLPAAAGEEALYTTLGAPLADGSCIQTMMRTMAVIWWQSQGQGWWDGSSSKNKVSTWYMLLFVNKSISVSCALVLSQAHKLGMRM